MTSSLHERPATARGAQAAAVPVLMYHEISAEIVLESLDPLSDRCGRYPECAPGRLQRSQPQRQLERLKGLKVRQ